MRCSVLLAILIVMTVSAKADGLKLYIGSAEKQETQSTRHYIQFILCNNYLDTVYVKKSDLDNLFPRITTDASEVTSGGTFYLINHAINLITDKKRMDEVYVASGTEVFDRTLKKEKQQFEENNKLPNVDINGEAYYVVAPSKCLTIHNLSLIPIKEVLKLWDLTDSEKNLMEVYYTTKVKYHSAADKNDRSELLIARPSDDLKKILLAGHVKQD